MARKRFCLCVCVFVFSVQKRTTHPPCFRPHSDGSCLGGTMYGVSRTLRGLGRVRLRLSCALSAGRERPARPQAVAAAAAATAAACSSPPARSRRWRRCRRSPAVAISGAMVSGAWLAPFATVFRIVLARLHLGCGGAIQQSYRSGLKRHTEKAVSYELGDTDICIERFCCCCSCCRC